MSRRVTLRDLWTVFRDCAVRTRIHVVGRQILSPMCQIAAFASPGGACLDLGCGHGLFALHLLRGSDDRTVLGVDLSAEKIAEAKRARLPAGRARFECVGYEHVAERDFMTISVLDVLYLIPAEHHDAVFRWCREHVSDVGVLLIKEIGDRPRWKFWINYLEETLAVRVLGITLGSRLYFSSPAATARRLRAAGFRVDLVPLDRGYLHPHVLYLCRPTPAAAA